MSFDTYSAAWNKLTHLARETGWVDAIGMFEGDRIAGRVVKYVDPSKSTKGESSHQGHTR